LPLTTRAKSSFYWLSYFRKLTSDITLATEWSNWQFRTVAFSSGGGQSKGPSGRGNVVNVALAYQFRILCHSSAPEMPSRAEA